MKLLVTGGAGFIGSNFVKYMAAKYNYMIIVLDALTYAGSLSNLEDIPLEADFEFVEGDITDAELVDALFELYKFDVVINFAAESHVDRSISSPGIFIKTNIMGTHVLLEAAKKHWTVSLSKESYPQYKDSVRFIQISTDEVYGTLGPDGYFTEETNLSPNSPYSASKASADLLVRAYYETYELPIVISRCSNNFGPNQHEEKLIPCMIHRALQERPLPIYGDGRQVRDWLYVEDHCTAIDAILHKGKIGEVYNVGGNNERENIEVVKMIVNKIGKSEGLIQFVEDRLGHDRRYAIDNTKITNELGWTPSYTFEQGIEKTIDWYLNNGSKVTKMQ